MPSGSYYAVIIALKLKMFKGTIQFQRSSHKSEILIGSMFNSLDRVELKKKKSKMEKYTEYLSRGTKGASPDFSGCHK